MYQRQELFATVSPEEMTLTLNTCALPEKEEYTDDEGDRLRECLVLREQGKSYDEISQMFQQNGLLLSNEPQPTEPESSAKSKKPKNGKKPAAKPLDFSELLSLAKELSCSVSPKEALKLLQACGLSSDAEQYNQQECDRFLEACDLMKNQGRAYEEIAVQLGATEISPVEQITGLVSDSTLITEAGLERLVDKVTDRQTDKIPGMINRFYLKHAARKLAQGKENTELFFAELEERVMVQIEGKRQARSLPETWDWEPNSLPLSSPKPMSLPEGSENGTSEE
ncbi:MAG: hypothetical protein JOZ78_11555 [Chroococcidiopsidaceae cyanobacterium CP_BM_ER_R8_30]|nr:hypothetical protein [Chroococcidiopsidaceae cyanobacterium CP_BM_ER_R8_30]